MPQTPEEKKVKNIIKDAKLKSLEEIFHYQGPTPQPMPPGGGMFTGPQPGQKMVEEKAKKIEAIRQEALNKSANAIKGAPIHTQVKAFKIVDAYAYPDTAPLLGRKDEKDLDQSQQFAKGQMRRTDKNEKPPTKNIDEAQRSAMHKMGYTDMRMRHEGKKDLSQSQDYAMRKLGDEKEKERKPPEQPQKEAETFKGGNLSYSFSQSLGYSKLNKLLDKMPESKPEKTSMSGKAFSDGLSYNNLSKAAPEPGPAVASKFKDNSIDMDI